MKGKVKFSADERKRIAAVLDEYEKLIVPWEGSEYYNNDIGCGNCGDLGPAFKTVYKLKEAFGIKTK